jgi:hypothetical protein
MQPRKRKTAVPAGTRYGGGKQVKLRFRKTATASSKDHKASRCPLTRLLPSRPRKAGDRRSLHVHETVEAEAMPARVLRTLLRSEIEKLLPDNALMVSKAAEANERDFIVRIANMIGDGS